MRSGEARSFAFVRFLGFYKPLVETRERAAGGDPTGYRTPPGAERASGTLTRVPQPRLNASHTLLQGVSFSPPSSPDPRVLYNMCNTLYKYKYYYY
jgi:hypothetical protein